MARVVSITLIVDLEKVEKHLIETGGGEDIFALGKLITDGEDDPEEAKARLAVGLQVTDIHDV